MRDAHPLQSGNESLPAQRVLVTGIGMVTALGTGWAETWQAVRSGASAVAPTTRFASHGGIEPLAAEIRDFDPRRFFRIPKAIKLTDLKTRLAVAAAVMAVDDAGLEEATVDDLEVLVGCSSSDIDAEGLARAIAGPDQDRCAEDTNDFGRRMMAALNPLWLLINLPNMASAHVGIQLASTAPNRTLMTDWIAGTQALGEAFLAIRAGETTRAVAGGADTGVLPFYAGCWERSTENEDRGFAFGEGAAMMVLESEESATRRGARILGEICAYSSRGPRAGEQAGDGPLCDALGHVLDMSGWSEGHIDLACHFLPEAARSRQDQQAVERLRSTARLSGPVCEHRSQLGHCLAASGAIDAALALARLREQGPGRRALCWSTGLLDQAAVLALMSAEEMHDATTVTQ
jgi:3-oxoacyl-[acyl-carrier-protein] synthase II